MSAILIGYVIFLLIVGAFAAAGFYHAVKYRVPGDKTRLGSAIYAISAIILIVVSFILLTQADTGAV